MNRGGLDTGTSQAFNRTLITPSDTVDHPHKALSFVVAGDIAFVDFNDNVVIVPSGALAAGLMHPCGFKRINATGTDATGIVGYNS